MASSFKLKCLKCLLLVIAVLILTVAGIGPIIFAATYYNETLLTAFDIRDKFLAAFVVLGLAVILVSLCGIYGACKFNRCCLCWYFINLLPILLMSLIILIIFIMLIVQGNDSLHNFCNDLENTSKYPLL